jgi:predicted lipoprotein with Yx(FWY)xxD motif
MQYIVNNKSESQVQNVHDRGMWLFIFKVDTGAMTYCQHVCIFHYQA